MLFQKLILMNKERKFRILLIILTVLMVCSCRRMSPQKFIEQEQQEITEKIELILNELGYSDFSVHLYYHKTYNTRILSKSINSLKIIGDVIPINLLNYSAFQNQDYQQNYQDQIKNGYIEERSFVANYDDVPYLTGDHYEYISIVILMPDISSQESNKVQKLLSSYILNQNRGDTLYINSK